MSAEVEGEGGRRAAVFDLDGTLIRGTSAERLLGPWLVRRRMVGWRALAAAAGVAVTLPVVGRTRALRRNKRWLGRVDAEALGAVLAEFLDEAVAPRWCSAALERLRVLQSDGAAVFLLSGAPAFLVEAVGAHLGVEAVVGTEMEVRDGRYTGRLAGPHLFADAKPRAVRALAEEHGLDLGRSWAFADHASDVPFLELFAHPVAVEPDAGLRRVAEERGWEVLRCGGAGAEEGTDSGGREG